MIWFTSDEHFGHNKIIEYSDRPFDTVEEMDEAIISNHNQVVRTNDLVVHAGDFTLWKNLKGIYEKYIDRLNGKHIFLRGSHDYWLKGKNNSEIWDGNIRIDDNRYYIVVCHYAMRVWPRSHYNSYQLYGHSHGRLAPEGKQHDIGVDNNKFFPVSAKQIVEIMRNRPDNFNLIKKG